MAVTAPAELNKAGETGVAHEPVSFEGRSWEESRLHVEAELGRLANNIHALRGDINSYNLRMEVERKEDRIRLDGDLRTYLLRVAVLEAKVVIYGLVSGAIGMALMNWLISRLH